MKRKSGLAVALVVALLLQLVAGTAVWAASTECVGYVTNLSLVRIQDGSAPFDADDQPGNDANDNNRRVRSYDHITYDLTVEVASHDQQSHKDGEVEFEVSLPADKAVYLDHSSMGWAKHWEETQVGGNTLYSFGMDLHSQQADGNVIPGEYSVSLVLAVEGETEGAVVQPTVKSWFQNCTDEPKTCTPEAVTVTSAPNYNVVIKPGKILGRGRYTVGDTEVTGWNMAFGLALELNTGNPDKGIRGAELPRGDFAFDVQIYATVAEGDNSVAMTDGFAPLFQKLRNSQSGAGINGIPYSIDDGVVKEKDMIVYQNGNWTARWSADTATLSLQVTDYAIDMDKLPHQAFGGAPQYVTAGGKIQIAAFSSQIMDVVIPYRDVTDNAVTLTDRYGMDDADIRVNATVKNMKMGDTALTQSVASDDEANLGTAVTTQAGRNQEIFYSTWGNVGEGTEGGVGDVKTKTNGSDSAMMGSDLTYTLCYGENNVDIEDIDEHTTMLYQLVRFDDEALEVRENELKNNATYDDKWESDQLQWIGKDQWTLRLWYAAKPDGTGWTDDDELKAAKPEDLVYYETLAELKAAGKICVGTLHERRGFFHQSGNLFTRDAHRLYVKSGADIPGKVYMITATTYAWTAGDLAALVAADTLKNISSLTWEDHKAYAQSHSMVDYWQAGQAAPPRTPVDIHPAPKYEKAVYDSENGGYQGTETKGFGWGDSLYVIPYFTTVSKTVAQQVPTGEEGVLTDKAVFSMDAKERYVDYQIAATIAYGQGASLEGGNYPTTTVTLTDTLPKGLHYLPGSAYWGGTYQQQGTTAPGKVEGGRAVEPALSQDADGNTVLTWVIDGVSTAPGHTPSLHFTCTIGNMLSPALDVQAGDMLTNQVTVQTTEDIRLITPQNGNISQVGIKITKLGSYVITKTGDTDLECVGTAQYQMAMVNTSGTTQTNLCGIDTMPFHRYKRAVVLGRYTIESMQLDLEALKTIEQADDPAEGITVYYTHDSEYRGMAVTADEIRENWVQATLDHQTGAITDGVDTAEKLIGTWPVAWAILDDELAPSTADVVTLTFRLEEGEPGDQLLNTFSEGDKSTIHTPVVYGRSLSGTAWLDENKDGLMDAAEERLAGITVTLFQEEGGEYIPLQTQVTDGEGYYQFNRLLPGDYRVEFTGEGIAAYDITRRLVGDNPAKNSKATGEMAGDVLQKAVISDLPMPLLADIKAAGETTYREVYQNVGFVDPAAMTTSSTTDTTATSTSTSATDTTATEATASTYLSTTQTAATTVTTAEPTETTSTATSAEPTTPTTTADSSVPATGESAVWTVAVLVLTLTGVALLFLRKKQAVETGK